MPNIIIAIIGLTLFCTCLFLLFRNRKQLLTMSPAQSNDFQAKMIVFTAFITPVLMAITDELRSGFTLRSVGFITVLIIFMTPICFGMYIIARRVSGRVT